MLSRITTLGIIVLCFLCSCQEENCQSAQRNHILAANSYNSKEYQAELYRLIKESPEVDYYYEMREEIFGQHYLVVTAYGNAFCGKLCLVISEEDANHIEIDKTKGYQGAQLIGLKFNKQKADYGWSALVYDSVEYIVD
ncbi:hypothetical protein [uncultured Dokdonia sp.]|uniref:hypothetical protein n=1 Tax=Dokdonia sp. R78006 TaxID=3093866 RepID=UPI00261618A7|nr:hypothetical protein [uncultured Dokdonia sp.]